MKKNDVVKMVADYMEYVNNIDVHISNVKGINNGAEGNLYEMLIKLALNNCKFHGVSKKGCTDTTKKINNVLSKIEIKNGCGELGTLDNKGNIKTLVFKRDYIIFNIDWSPEYDVIQCSFICKAMDYYKILSESGLIRKKMSTAQYKRPKTDRYYDRIAIQSYKNSKRKTDLYYDNAIKYAVPLKQFLINNNIQSILL